MNAITPANEIPPDHSTAASGTLPTEQTKLRTAITGPTNTFSIVWTSLGRVLEEEGVEEVVAEQADEAREQEAERDLLPQHLPVAAEVVRDVGPRLDRASAAARQGIASAGRVVLVAGLRLAGRARAPPPRAAARRTAAAAAAMSAIITMPPTYSASVNCQPISTQRTSPSSQTRFVEANWKASADAADAPFWNSDLAIAIAA